MVRSSSSGARVPRAHDITAGRRSLAIALVLTCLVVAIAAYATWDDPRPPIVRGVPLVGTPGAPSTSRQDLDRATADLRARIRVQARNAPSGVALAGVLLRQARVRVDGTLALEAERVLLDVIDAHPLDYDARRMLGAVLLSQHRFRDAIRAAERASELVPDDAWNDGVLGDGYLEVGEYDRAFDAYDRMMRRRPSAQAYARMAHAFELQGRLVRALDMLEMSAEATSAHDPESQAWHHAQIGNVLFQLGRLGEARRAYERAAFVFPDHPYALVGLARITAAEGHYAAAIAAYERLFDRHPTPEIAAQLGDLHARLDNGTTRDWYYERAERLEREGWQVEEPQPGVLARFLADRGRKLAEAVRLAEHAAAARQDIFTEDALAWACFRRGRLPEALAASDRALRTGTRDRTILYHAAAIRHAAGDRARALALVEQALDGHPAFDLVNAPAALRLREALRGGQG